MFAKASVLKAWCPALGTVGRWNLLDFRTLGVFLKSVGEPQPVPHSFSFSACWHEATSVTHSCLDYTGLKAIGLTYLGLKPGTEINGFLLVTRSPQEFVTIMESW